MISPVSGEYESLSCSDTPSGLLSPQVSAPPANLLDLISIILGTPPFICGPWASDDSHFWAPIGQIVPLLAFDLRSWQHLHTRLP